MGTDYLHPNGTGLWAVCKVDSIGQPAFQGRTRFLELIGVDGSHYQRNLAEISPIPLTEKILKQNGFVDVGDGYWQNEKYACGVDTTKWMFYVYVLDYDDHDCHDVAVTCTVNQLQKALRLCERENLAETLKV